MEVRGSLVSLVCLVLERPQVSHKTTNQRKTQHGERHNGVSPEATHSDIRHIPVYCAGRHSAPKYLTIGTATIQHVRPTHRIFGCSHTQTSHKLISIPVLACTSRHLLLRVTPCDWCPLLSKWTSGQYFATALSSTTTTTIRSPWATVKTLAECLEMTHILVATWMFHPCPPYSHIVLRAVNVVDAPRRWRARSYGAAPLSAAARCTNAPLPLASTLTSRSVKLCTRASSGIQCFHTQ